MGLNLDCLSELRSVADEVLSRSRSPIRRMPLNRSVGSTQARGGTVRRGRIRRPGRMMLGHLSAPQTAARSVLSSRKVEKAQAAGEGSTVNASHATVHARVRLVSSCEVLHQSQNLETPLGPVHEPNINLQSVWTHKWRSLGVPLTKRVKIWAGGWFGCMTS